MAASTLAGGAATFSRAYLERAPVADFPVKTRIGLYPSEIVELLAPIVTYWVYATFFHVMSLLKLTSVELHRIPTDQALRPKNRVTVRGVLLQVAKQHLIEVAVGLALAFSDRPEDLTYWRVERPLVLVAKLFAGMLIMDTYQYWMHRLMHTHRGLYRRFHSVHHELTAPFAYGALYNHVVEGVVMDMAGAGIPKLLLRMHPWTSAIFYTLASLKTVDDHCGYALVSADSPLWWRCCWPLQALFSNNAAYHDVHHWGKGRQYNFAQPFFTFWDRAMGTEYEAAMARKRALLAARSGTTVDGKPALGHQTASVGKMTAKAAKAVRAATIASATASATTSSASASASASSSVSSSDETDDVRGVRGPSASSRHATKRASKAAVTKKSPRGAPRAVVTATVAAPADATPVAALAAVAYDASPSTSSFESSSESDLLVASGRRGRPRRSVVDGVDVDDGAAGEDEDASASDTSSFTPPPLLSATAVSRRLTRAAAAAAAATAAAAASTHAVSGASGRTSALQRAPSAATLATALADSGTWSVSSSSLSTEDGKSSLMAATPAVVVVAESASANAKTMRGMASATRRSSRHTAATGVVHFDSPMP